MFSISELSKNEEMQQFLLIWTFNFGADSGKTGDPVGEGAREMSSSESERKETIAKNQESHEKTPYFIIKIKWFCCWNTVLLLF